MMNIADMIKFVIIYQTFCLIFVVVRSAAYNSTEVTYNNTDDGHIKRYTTFSKHTTTHQRRIQKHLATNSKQVSSATFSKTRKQYLPTVSTSTPSLKLQESSAMKSNQPTVNTSSCILKTSRASVGKFRHIAYFGDLSYVYLNLHTPENVVIKGAKRTVGENIWVWTYFGKKGGLEFLRWPVEFGIWSLGLLYSFAYGPLDIFLEYVSGDCSNLTVGQVSSDYVISSALLDLTREMSQLDNNRYNATFWCYKRRMYINPVFLYDVCKHIVCPLEALEYACCSYFYNTLKHKREVQCREQDFRYDTLWWIGPTIIATILFAFSPLLLLNLSWRLSLKTELSPNKNVQFDIESVIFYDETNRVTLLNTLFLPLSSLFSSIKSKSSRIVRFIFPFITLSLVVIQILLDHYFLENFILTCVDKGVPLGFRSMIAGFTKSTDNFLPHIGGPYISLSVYLLLTCSFASAPGSLSQLLSTGLPSDSTDTPASPLCFRLRFIERFGTVSICNRRGYRKLYNTYLGNFYMIINVKFWRHVMLLQIKRGQHFFSSRIRLFLLPLYFVFCLVELLLCLTLYGLPMVSFGLTIVRAYWQRLQEIGAPNLFWKGCVSICQLTSIICVVFFLFMFGTIFLDGTLFFSRIIIFTYSGVVVYPKVSYGYIIFALTVIYYVSDCFQTFARTYKSLLKNTIRACEAIEREGDNHGLVIVDGDIRGVKKSLYEHVIESVCPLRKRVFVSVIQLITLLGVIGLSVKLVTKIDTFRELHVVMHVGTVVFVCALPQITKKMCKINDMKIRQQRLMRKIENAVKDHLGYFTEISDCELSQ